MIARRWRLRLPVLWLLRCFLPAWLRFSLPVALTRKRFLAPLCVFILGIVITIPAGALGRPCTPKRKGPLVHTKGPEVVGSSLVPTGEGTLYKKVGRRGGGKRCGLRGFWRQHRRHPFAFHRRRFLDLGQVSQFLQHTGDDSLALLNVLQLTAPEEDVDQHLVLVLEELAGLVDLGFDIVVAGLGADPNFLEL